MCGIVGYLGKKAPVPLLVQSLKQLEYRGYDSSGLAVLDGETAGFFLVKAEGKLSNLEAKLNGKAATAEGNGNLQVGIGHIRWATHGAPNHENAHPHPGHTGEIMLVHNGIFENFIQLRQSLIAEGVTFLSQTDTECASHLLESNACKHPDNFMEAFRQSLHQLKGAYALCFMRKDAPNKLYVAKYQAPLVIGLGEGEMMVASDTVALAPLTEHFIFLKDGQYAEISIAENNVDGVRLFNLDGTPAELVVERLQTEALTIDKRGFKHFMLKEIYEQPDVLRNSLYGRLLSSELPIALLEDEASIGLARQLKEVNRIVILGCGTSYNAGLVAKYFLEALVRLPVEVEAAGEFRYRNPVLDERTLVLAISQSGETADTLEAVKQAKQCGVKTLIITNRPESTMARVGDAVLAVRAGVEVSVCATKSFTAQLVVLYLLGLYLSEHRQSADSELLTHLKHELVRLPSILEQVLATVCEPLQAMAKQYGTVRDMIFIARGIQYPVALEGALKLKEISYIHAEGYSGAELKHGPIALLDANMPVLAVLAEGPLLEKMISNCQEAKARDAKLIGIISRNREEILHLPEGLFDSLLEIPATHELLSPLLTTVPLQLLSYYIAEYLGKDVDQPRNLAKSVTVE